MDQDGAGAASLSAAVQRSMTAIRFAVSVDLVSEEIGGHDDRGPDLGKDLLEGQLIDLEDGKAPTVAVPLQSRVQSASRSNELTIP